MEEMWMTTPAPRSIIPGTRARSRRTAASRLRLIEPSLISECGESAAGSTRAAEIVHENVQASQILGDGFGSLGRSRH